MKKTFTLLLLALLISASLYAGDFLCANDLTPQVVTETIDFDGVLIIGTSNKNVTIESLGDQTREAEDGEIFNVRIKLNGGGKLTERSLRVTCDEAGSELCVYLNSSSKSDARVLIVADENGEIVATLTAPQDNGTAGFASCTLDREGEYYVYSKSSGINIYMIYC